MVLDRRNIFSISFMSFIILIELCPASMFCKTEHKMSPEPSFFAISNSLDNC